MQIFLIISILVEFFLHKHIFTKNEGIFSIAYFMITAGPHGS